MDCEKFDRVVLDLLYEELDELTSAAAKRHMEHCSRCRSIGSGLRATREVGILPLIEASSGLEQRILDAERKARAGLPLRQRVGRAISVMAGYAMRPQLAMAALAVLMVGASLLFLRARPGDRENVHVTERGVPESEGESVALVPMPEKLPGSDTSRGAQSHGALKDEAERARDMKNEPVAAEPGRAEKVAAAPLASVPAASAPAELAAGEAIVVEDGGADDEYGQAMAAYRSGQYGEAQRRFDAVVASGGKNAASASLLAAQAARIEVGCGVAATRFDAVSSRYPRSNIGNEAAWQAADCYRSLGQVERARKNYQALLGAPGYADRAQQALHTLNQEAEQVASRRAKSAPAKAKAGAAASPKAAPPAAKPPSVDSSKQ